MRTESRSSEEVIQKALNFFGQNGFSYTLKPPLLGREAIDDFLFTTRKGYCEHFASAFAFLMRAAGVHARIVGGYLGGELNPYGDYLIVRHSDAHVWVETWLSGKGWVRVDPTTTVAPQRVAQGVAAALPPEERQAFSSLVRFGPFAGYLKAVLLGMDTLNNQWNRTVLGYSYLRQKALLDKFGPNIGNRPGLVRGFLIGVGLTGCLALFYLYRIFGRTTLKKDRVQQIYFAFCTKLERVGLARRPSQGPLDYAEIVLAARADLRAKVLAIVKLYIQLRYGRGGDADDLKKFRIMVKRFNPLKPPGGHQG
jgi:hypothetical protein